MNGSTFDRIDLEEGTRILGLYEEWTTQEEMDGKKKVRVNHIVK